MKICGNCNGKYQTAQWLCPKCRHEPEYSCDGFPMFARALSELNQGFPPESFDRLMSIESGSFWFRSRNRLITWALSRYFPGAENLLEIGCGTGFVLSGIRSAFPLMQLHGAEIYTQGLKYVAERLHDTSLMQLDARSIPFEDEFDVIGAFDVLEHIQEDEIVLQQLHQAVKKRSGGVILTVPQHKNLWSVVDDYSCHVRRYEASELTSKLEKSGFEVVAMMSFVSLLLPLLYLSRAKKQSLESFDPEGEYNMPRWLDRSLETVLSLERVAIKCGLRFPAGGSLLVAARAQERPKARILSGVAN